MEAAKSFDRFDLSQVFLEWKLTVPRHLAKLFSCWFQFSLLRDSFIPEEVWLLLLLVFLAVVCV